MRSLKIGFSRCAPTFPESYIRSFTKRAHAVLPAYWPWAILNRAALLGKNHSCVLSSKHIKKIMRQAEAVIFDLDGCLVDTECLSIQAIVDEMLRLGIETASFEKIRDKFLGISMWKICTELADQVEGFNADRFVSRFEARLFAEYETKVPLIKGAFEMLLSLEQAGVPIGLATGGSLRRMQKTLEYSGLSGWLQNRAFSAEQVKLGKPAPDLFLLVASQLGFAPENCFVLEDSPHGVVGGRAAGMTVLGFVGGSHLAGIKDKHASLLRAKGAAAVVSDLNAATDLFLSRGGRDCIQREVD